MNLRTLRKRTMLLTIAFTVPLVTAMLLFIGSRKMVMSDVVAYALDEPMVGYELLRSSLLREETAADLIIPLPDHVHFENVRVENRYMEHRLMVYVETSDTLFYHEEPIPCNELKVTYGACLVDEEKDAVCLRFDLNGLYEYDVDILNNHIRFYLTPPAARYARTVVIDPAAPDGDTDYALMIASSLRSYNTEDAPFRIYISRTAQDTATETERLRLIADTGAARYLQISATSNAGTPPALRAYYNDRYFIRGYGNVDLAYDIMEECALRSGITDGSFETDLHTAALLTSMKIPSAALDISGFTGTDADARTCEQIAEGIYRALLESFKEQEDK